MLHQWITNTIFISRIPDESPIYTMLQSVIEKLRDQDVSNIRMRRHVDLEFLHTTICYTEGEFQLILHILSSETIMDEVSSFLGKAYQALNIKYVEIDSANDIVNFMIHEKGQLQNEKTVPRGLSRHLVEELEQAPLQGNCYSFTIPELFNQDEAGFIARLRDLKYNKQKNQILENEDELQF